LLNSSNINVYSFITENTLNKRYFSPCISKSFDLDEDLDLRVKVTKAISFNLKIT